MTKSYRPQKTFNPKNDALHERAVLCARLARLLIATLTSLDWQALRFADRSRLARALMRLTSDARLAALAAEDRAEPKAQGKRQAPKKRVSADTAIASCSRE